MVGLLSPDKTLAGMIFLFASIRVIRGKNKATNARIIFIVAVSHKISPVRDDPFLTHDDNHGNCRKARCSPSRARTTYPQPTVSTVGNGRPA